MNKNSPLNQRYVCPIGADGIQFEARYSIQLSYGRVVV